MLIGAPSIEDVFRALKPVLIRNEREVLRTLDSYLGRAGRSMLIDSLVIQGTRTISFLVMVSGRDDGVVIRLYPKLDVEKTEGVKRVLAELAKQLLAAFPTFTLGETNLREYLV